MKRFLVCAGLFALLASPVFAAPPAPSLANPTVYNLDGTQVLPSRPNGQDVPESPQGTTYNIYTGVASAAGALFLLEPTAPPVRDDVVPFDLLPDPINDYVAAAGGITRDVNETIAGPVTALAISVIVTGSGELCPAGFVGGGNPLTSCGFGIGLNLGAALGGADPLFWAPGPNIVNTASLHMLDAGGAELAGGPFALPPATFFGGAAGWNGVLGIALSNSTGLGLRSIRLDLVVNKTPEPGTLALLGLGGLALVRRRR